MCVKNGSGGVVKYEAVQWTSYYMDLSPEDAILEIAKNGYKYAELSDEHAAAPLL